MRGLSIKMPKDSFCTYFKFTVKNHVNCEIFLVRIGSPTFQNNHLNNSNLFLKSSFNSSWEKVFYSEITAWI